MCSAEDIDFVCEGALNVILCVWILHLALVEAGCTRLRFSGFGILFRSYLRFIIECLPWRFLLHTFWAVVLLELPQVSAF